MKSIKLKPQNFSITVNNLDIICATQQPIIIIMHDIYYYYSNLLADANHNTHDIQRQKINVFTGNGKSPAAPAASIS